MVPLFGVVVIAVGVVAGCERQGSRQVGGDRGDSEWVTDSENPEAPDEKSAQVVEHDFGIVAPKEKLTHRFGISNNGSIPWTLRTIVNTCSCTAASVSASSIAPGQTEHVEVEYRAGDITSDSRRQVVVLFEETDAPVVMLVVKARVREAVSSFPAELAFRQLGRGQVRDANFEIQNFSDCDWRSVSVEPSIDWLAVSCTPVTAIAREALPRQVWRVTVRADAGKLGSGEHRAGIAVRSTNPAHFARTIPVVASVISPVNAIPGQFFFGSVPAGGSVTRAISLRFTPDDVPPSVDAVQLQHDLGGQLRLSWSRSLGELWELQGTLTPRGDNGAIRGRVSIGFAKPTLPRIELPVLAVVENRQ